MDKCQYDERNDEWILPYIKSSFKGDNGDFKLPDIEQSNRYEDTECKNSGSSEGKLSARNSKIPRPSSKDNHNHSNHHEREEKHSRVDTRENSPISSSHALPAAVSMKPPIGGSKSSGTSKSKDKDKSSKKETVADTIVKHCIYYFFGIYY